MPLQFPTNPTLNQTYSSGSSSTYVWNGTFWQTVLPPTQMVLTATSASFSQTSSFATSASFSQTASYVKLEAGKVLISETGSWTVPVGSAQYSFTVPADNTYVMYVKGNIPNGIITWNAIATISNNNVPVVGAQYTWVYSGGGTPLDITAIPDQFVGASSTIVRSAGSGVSIPSNTFRFTINNTSGATRTVYYGYTQL